MIQRLHGFFCYFCATLFGTGFSPIAPGTVGSLVTVLLIWLWFPAGLIGQLLLLLVVSVVAIHTSGWYAEANDKGDPSEVVADEVAGQLLTFVGFAHVLNIPALLVGFALFRLFDIWKPAPVSRLEKLPGGLGIVCDDLMAGLLANICLQLIWFLF